MTYCGEAYAEQAHAADGALGAPRLIRGVRRTDPSFAVPLATATNKAGGS